ncbi:ExeA family protein [Paracoccus panacisoli]|uniref:ExeA family protein n=1 Tax=Paracoccus panacisoli TaxID=1510163 RepID=A0ABV6T7T4_9RHOB|nr:AAA family ATPase [Paracoccus sanguinis]
MSQLYLDHFGFTARPFSILPDPSLIFWSAAHGKAFTVLEYGLMTHAPLTVVTGEVGTGKSTLVQALLRQSDPGVRFGLVSNARGDRGDLLRWVLNALDVAYPADADYVRLFHIFQDFVVARYAAGQRVVLIFDEAQNLGMDMLEELRMLTNMNSGTDELLQLILLGQPELRDMITRPELRQFAQRVTATYHLEGMDAATTGEYIRHRLRQVGGTGHEFSPEAIRRIHAEAGGVPRMVNKICDLALVYASAADRRVVQPELIEELIADGLVLKAADIPATPPASGRIERDHP